MEGGGGVTRSGKGRGGRAGGKGMRVLLFPDSRELRNSTHFTSWKPCWLSDNYGESMTGEENRDKGDGCQGMYHNDICKYIYIHICAHFSIPEPNYPRDFNKTIAEATGCWLWGPLGVDTAWRWGSQWSDMLVRMRVGAKTDPIALQEGRRVSSGVPLVPVPHREPHTEKLCKWEEESNAAHQVQALNHRLLDWFRTGFARTGCAVLATATCCIIGCRWVSTAELVIFVFNINAGWVIHIISHIFAVFLEAAAAEELLCIAFSGVVGEFPTLPSESLLLLFVHSEACTGHRELDDEDDEQNNHVEEQQHLMMFTCSNETHYGYD